MNSNALTPRSMTATRVEIRSPSRSASVPSPAWYSRNTYSPYDVTHPANVTRYGPRHIPGARYSPGPKSYTVTDPGVTSPAHSPTSCGCADAGPGRHDNISAATATTTPPIRRLVMDRPSSLDDVSAQVTSFLSSSAP